jgi:hypothetical protein
MVATNGRTVTVFGGPAFSDAVLRRFKRWKYRLHPAIDSQAKALGHRKVSACDVAGLWLVRYRQRLFRATPSVAPAYLIAAFLDRGAEPFARFS